VLVTLIYLAFQTRQNTMAIMAELNATRFIAGQTSLLTEATSTELQEALAEDRVQDLTINQARRHSFWHATLRRFQRTILDVQRGLLPHADEATLSIERTTGVLMVSLFNSYRSMDAWWEDAKNVYTAEFVEWVEEQRSKAA
jgi:hypothetical protein